MEEELFEYGGLEIGISISKLSDLKDYWSTKMFYSQEDLRKIMSR